MTTAQRLHERQSLTVSHCMGTALAAAGVSLVSYLTLALVSSLAGRRNEPMGKAHKLDCEAAANDCRFIIQSENETEAIELAKKHMSDAHGQDYTDEELRGDYLQTV